MVCKSPCFWCCFVLNCGRYYTTCWPQNQGFIGRDEDFSREKGWSSIAASKDAIEKFVLILAPFAPHIAEELWQRLGHTDTLTYEPWPEYDPELVKEKEVELAVQVMGKIEDKIVVAADASEDEIKEKALASQPVQTAMAGKEPRKIIVIKSRLVNIVV